MGSLPLVPAKAGTHFALKEWIPAFAGMSGAWGSRTALT
jgi:hypothetical protein